MHRFLILLIPAVSAAQSMTVETIGEDFQFTRLARLARTRLAGRADPVVKVTMFAAEPPAIFLTQSPVETFSAWLTSWKSAARYRWRVAEAVSIAGNAVLRIRHGRATTRIVLAGRDPLFIPIGSRRYEILHVSSPRKGAVAVYARGPEPLPCSALLAELRRSIPLAIALRMRTDPWFLNDPGFPPYYWFHSAEAPSRDAVRSGSRAYCGE